MSLYRISNINYDTDGEDVDLPTEMEVRVPEDLEKDAIQEFLSDYVSGETGYCHLGFSFEKVDPEATPPSPSFG